MPFTPPPGFDPTSPKGSQKVENDKFQNQQKALDSELDQPVYKPYALSTQNSTEGNPVGVIRKYYDKISTEFGIVDIDELRKELSSEWERKGFTKE